MDASEIAKSVRMPKLASRRASFLNKYIIFIAWLMKADLALNDMLDI